MLQSLSEGNEAGSVVSQILKRSAITESPTTLVLMSPTIAIGWFLINPSLAVANPLDLPTLLVRIVVVVLRGILTEIEEKMTDHGVGLIVVVLGAVILDAIIDDEITGMTEMTNDDKLGTQFRKRRTKTIPTQEWRRFNLYNIVNLKRPSYIHKASIFNKKKENRVRTGA